MTLAGRVVCLLLTQCGSPASGRSDRTENYEINTHVLQAIWMSNTEDQFWFSLLMDRKRIISQKINELTKPHLRISKATQLKIITTSTIDQYKLMSIDSCRHRQFHHYQTRKRL